MIKIEFTEPAGTAWMDWKERCVHATGVLHDEFSRGKKGKISDLYKGRQEVYLDASGPFHGKCAYCESAIAADQPGDLDHFRPKGAVADINGDLIMIDDGVGGTKVHPGYYWLSYAWHNLLPACRDCNSVSKKKSGTAIGKGIRFPVRGLHAVCPGEEASEQPLLINPTRDGEDPAQHVDVLDNGVMVWKTDRGETTVEVFGLNKRPKLVQARSEVFWSAWGEFVSLVDALRAEEWDRLAKIAQKLHRYESGEATYAAAGRAGIKCARARQFKKHPRLVAALGWL